MSCPYHSALWDFKSSELPLIWAWTALSTSGLSKKSPWVKKGGESGHLDAALVFFLLVLRTESNLQRDDVTHVKTALITHKKHSNSWPWTWLVTPRSALLACLWAAMMWYSYMLKLRPDDGTESRVRQSSGRGWGSALCESWFYKGYYYMGEETLLYRLIAKESLLYKATQLFGNQSCSYQDISPKTEEKNAARWKVRM